MGTATRQDVLGILPLERHSEPLVGPQGGSQEKKYSNLSLLLTSVLLLGLPIGWTRGKGLSSQPPGHRAGWKRWRVDPQGQKRLSSTWLRLTEPGEPLRGETFALSLSNQGQPQFWASERKRRGRTGRNQKSNYEKSRKRQRSRKREVGSGRGRSKSRLHFPGAGQIHSCCFACYFYGPLLLPGIVPQTPQSSGGPGPPCPATWGQLFMCFDSSSYIHLYYKLFPIFTGTF